MKWKVEVLGDRPSEGTVQLLARRTDLPMDSVLLSFSRGETVVCAGLSEGEAQKIADGLKRDRGVTCRVLPDGEGTPEPVQLYRVLLVNYRPGYRTRLRRRLQEMTRLPQEQVIDWLSRMPFALSKGVDSETARKIRKSLTESGGIVRIETETPIQENLATRRKSNAVFRPSPRSEPKTDESDTLFGRKEPAESHGTASGEPPVTGLPEGFFTGPPPLDTIHTPDGVVLMHPPPRFAAGIPSVCMDTGYALEPPLLPDSDPGAIPCVLVLAPPEAQSTEPPPVVGSRAFSSWANETAPDRVILHPPPSRLDTGMFLPPVLQRRAAAPVSETPLPVREDTMPKGPSQGGETVLHPAAEAEPEPPVEPSREEIKARTVLSDFRVLTGGGPLRLFLCRPSPDDEDTVVEALRDVLGVSVRDSWDLLRKAPTLVREFEDHTSAILTVHQLESRGVTVSLSRRSTDGRSGPDGTGEGLRAWLTGNG
ncbi:MAG: hypothetical protein AVO35_07300 [Candidatus Aegiribacteria sp. MLS_C]|nr:MAG: hypothetical protein AVO35_07300 [Candidatus Aegiribacteria sp. MLS_C]